MSSNISAEEQQRRDEIRANQKILTNGRYVVDDDVAGITYKVIIIDTVSNRVLEKIESQKHRSSIPYVDERENIEVLDSSEVDANIDDIDIGDRIISGQLQPRTVKSVYTYRLAEQLTFKGRTTNMRNHTFSFDDELTEQEKTDLENQTGMKIINESDNSDVIAEINTPGTMVGDTLMSDERKAFLQQREEILYGESRKKSKSGDGGSKKGKL